jgi:D-sedoheptulose 7-phosphate isomerase
VESELHQVLDEKFNLAATLFTHPEVRETQRLLDLSNLLLDSFLTGGKIVFVGNGGSAAEATHLAAEFVGKCLVEHRPLAAISLADSISTITAIGNDYGMEFIFERQVQALVTSKDIVLCLSTSGKSQNILRAIDAANVIGAYTILWMGDFDNTSTAKDVWKVPSKITPRIQEVHLLWGHLLAEIIEIAPEVRTDS